MIFISSFTFREWGGSSRWEPRRIESRGADRSHHLPFPRTIEREYTRSTRWAKVRHPHRHPGEASTPLLPHTTSLCVSCTLWSPVAVWPYGWHLHNRAPPCPRGNPWSSGHTGNTITHAARQAATRYRKAEIDNAGGPPAPYPNLDTRPAPAPGSSRQDPALPSVSPPFIRASSSSISSYLRFHFVRTLTREIMEITIILSSLIFCLSSVLQKTKNCCDLLRVSSPISSYSFALRWNLNQEKKLFVSMILSSLIFSLLRKDKNCCDYSCLLFNQAIETVVILTVI